MLTDRAGNFRFRFAPDTTAVYLTSTRYQGIEYFSPAVHTNPALPDTALRIVVSDTSTTAPVQLEARHLVVGNPGEDGSRAVLDLIILHNPGDRTRVPPDSTRPSWSAPLPTGSFGLEAGEGDVSPQAVRRVGNRVEVLAPIAPGEKQLVVQYGLLGASRSVRLPFDQSAELVNVLIADRGARVSGGGLARADTEVIQGRTYQRWTGPVSAGMTVEIRLSGPTTTPRWVLPLLVGWLAGALAIGAVRILRARPAPAGGGVAPGALEADFLVEEIARLDARYAGREGGTDPGEWNRYRAERARLKAELEAALATPSGRA